MISSNLFIQSATLLFAFWAEGGINPLIPRTVNLIIFLVVIFLILRKPFAKAMVDRRSEIKAELVKAKAEKAEAEQKLREIETRLSRLDEEIAEIKVNAENEAKAEYDRLLKQAGEEAARLKTMAEREIEGAAKAAQLQLKEFAAAKSVELAEKIIRKEIRPEDNSRLIEDFAKELEEVK
jgi:F-type H+-transporting ATPase subunit b